MGTASKSEFRYIPMLQQAATDMKFHYYEEDGTLGIKANCVLVRSIDELKEYAKDFEGKGIAVDTETTGLSYLSDFIVGFSISKDAYSGIYVPIRHEIKRVNKRKTTRLDEDGNIMYTKANKPRQMTVEDVTYFPCEANLPDKEALDILYDIMSKAKCSLMHNSSFDLNMIKKEGYDVNKLETFDTMILPYTYDPEGRGYMGLKKITKLALGRYVPEFKDVLGKEDNFRYVDPEKGFEYACYDSMNTFGVFQRIKPLVSKLLARFKGKGIIIGGEKYNILKKDNELIKAFVDYYDHTELAVDRNVAIEYKAKIIADLSDVSEKIYTYFNRGQFSLSTGSKEFKSAMADKNVITGAYTKKGAISYGKEGLKAFKRNLKALRLMLDNFEIIKFENSKLDKRGTIMQHGKVVVQTAKKSKYTSIGLKLSRMLLIYGEPYFNIHDDVNFMHLLDKKDNKINREDFCMILEHLYEKEKEKFEVLINIQRNSSLNKAMNSYVDKLTKVDSCRMRYKLLATNSSRLASGNGSKSDKNKNDYYIDLNAQNLTKPKSCFYEAVLSDDEDVSVLGYKFTEVPYDYAHEHSNTKIIVEGSSVNANIRNCIVAPKGRYVMSRDYSSQEYLALAILSKDSKMLSNFKKGLDPHTSTAYAIWGEKNYTKDKRKKAKTCLGKNSFVQTGNGLVRPYNLSRSSVILDKHKNSQKYAMTTDYGKLIRVQYSTGIVEEYTPNHRVEVWTGKEFAWKEVQNLTSEDNVIQLCNTHNVIVKDNYIDVSEQVSKKYSCNSKININSESFAYFAGLYVSSGNLTLSTNPKGTKGSKSIKFRNVSDMEKVLSSLEQIGVKIDKCCTKNKTFDLVIKHPPLGVVMKDLFNAKHQDRVIPDYIYNNWNSTLISKFILGFLEGSSNVGANEVLTYSTSNIKLVQGLALMCSLVGIKTSMKDLFFESSISHKLYFYDKISRHSADLNRKLDYTRNSHKGSWSFDMKYMRSFAQANMEIVRKNNLYSTFNDFERSITSTITNGSVRKLNEYFSNFPLKDNMVCAKVMSKEETEGDIYVIQTENHEYISSCIVSHNCNFLMNYGGSEYGLAESLEITVDEARDIIVGYEEAFFECVQWKKNEIQNMSRNGGVVFTEFGRPRQFGSWIKISANMSDAKDAEGLQNKVNRRVASHQIQGLCGDVCRNVLIELYKKYFRDRDPHIDFISTIHDEVNFSVTKSKLVEYARECEDVMKFDVLRKDLPISTSLEVGYSYGNCYPFVWEDATRTKLVPKRV